MKLADVISQISPMNYDSLRDLRDLVEYHIFQQQEASTDDPAQRRYFRYRQGQVRWRRRGLKPLSALYYPKALSDIPQMPLEERETLLAALNGLVTAKAPVAAQNIGKDDQPIAKGSFQTKKFVKTYLVTDPQTGEISTELRETHYLYLRVYTSAGDDDRKTHRYASIYIGSLNRQTPKPFLTAVQDGHITPEQIIATFQQGGYKAVAEWRQDMDSDD